MHRRGEEKLDSVTIRDLHWPLYLKSKNLGYPTVTERFL